MACAWIHCNICLRLPASNSRYFVSNCGHIACDRCVEKKLIAPVCSICKRESKVEEINKDLREDLRKYFVNIHDFAVKSFNEIKSIIEFQSKNCRRLMRHKMEKIQELQNSTIRHSEDSATIAKLQQQVEALEARNLDLENENKTLNSSFINQQTLVNQILSSGGMNITPSFLQSSVNGNMTQQDLFNLVNASYLNASVAQKIQDESNLQESIMTPHQLALDQSSLNFGQQSFSATPRTFQLEKILAQSTQKSTKPDRSTSFQQQAFSTLRPTQQQQIAESLRIPSYARPTQQQIAESLRTPSNHRVTQQQVSESLRTPSNSRVTQQQVSERLGIPSYARPTQQQIAESLRTPSNPRVTQPRQSSSVRPSQRLPDSIAAKNRSQTDKLNYSSRSWGGFRSDNSTLSTRTTRSAPPKTNLYKTPVVTMHSLSSSNLRTPQPHPISQSQRSRTVCPHWPKARCRCNNKE